MTSRQLECPACELGSISTAAWPMRSGASCGDGVWRRLVLRFRVVCRGNRVGNPIIRGGSTDLAGRKPVCATGTAKDCRVDRVGGRCLLMAALATPTLRQLSGLEGVV